MNQTSVILTDENAMKFFIWLVCIMGTIILILGGFILNKIFSEVKASRTERSEFTNALNHKFKALNSYVRNHDRTSLIHEEKIKNLVSDHENYKKKTDEHAHILTRHEAEIKNLKEGA